MRDGSFRDLVSTQPALAFGRFKLFPFQKLLLDGDKSLRLGSRAFDILAALVERGGEVLSRGELTAIAWPDTFVEESSLRVHISALRRILGQGDETSRFIVNVSGRGYCFTAPVQRLNWEASFAQTPQPIDESPALPAAGTRLIGRDPTVRLIVEQARARRITTVTGSGGIGKTTVALAAAEVLSDQLRDGSVFVDFASLDDHRATPAAIASALGVGLAGTDPNTGLVQHLRHKQMLLVLDNCEHVLETVASIVEVIVAGSDGVLVLATSREPMRIAGEWVHRLAPLGFPDANEICSPANAGRFSAVELFIERATAATDTFELDDNSARALGRICRELDGLPLAIEIVAAQVATFTLEELADRFGKNAMLDAPGSRTAQSRHQSMSALLEWSYQLLDADEQAVLRRLSAFRGRFSHTAAMAVACAGTVDRSRVMALLGELAAKSLISTDISSDQLYYRLPVVTRAFGATKLEASPEHRDTLRRHAECCRDILAHAQTQWGKIGPAEWLQRYGGMVDDGRAGLDWAFSSDGDVRIGLELTTAFTTLAFRLWLIEELKQRIALALATYPFEAEPAPLLEARLCIALANLHAMTTGNGQEVAANYAKALDIASRLGVNALQVEALAGSFAWAYGMVDYRSAESYAQQIAMIAGGLRDPAVAFLADRCLSQARSGLGDQTRAITLSERVLNSPVKTVPPSYLLFPIDVQVSMRIVQARGQWLLGRSETAREIAREAVKRSFGDAAYAPCQAWAMAAIPIAIWTGDFAAASEMTDRMQEHCQRLALGWWVRWAAHLAEVVRIKAADARVVAPTGVSSNTGPMVDEYLGSLDPHYVGPDLMHRVEANHAAWCAPEILRARALQAASAGEDDQFVVGLLNRSLDMARRQGSLAWELRTATTLAQRLVTSNALDAARDLLRPVVIRFTEGHLTVDLETARRVLAATGT